MKNRRGYFEDRRPASNMDPYLVTQRVMMNATGEGRRQVGLDLICWVLENEVREIKGK